MRIGLITGTGSYDWPGFSDHLDDLARTPYGEVPITNGRINGVEVVHISRHGPDHARLSNQVNHRANVRAVIDAGADALISLTVCGAVDPSLPLGSLVVFDDLYFPSNRLPDGSLCTWHIEPGGAGRGHWIFDRPYSEPLRQAVIAAAAATGTPAQPEGCYGQVDGPRFNTRTEILDLAHRGVSAISQTAGPETVLAGEAELPVAVVGFLTDYANGVRPSLEPGEGLLQRIEASRGILAAVVENALPRIQAPATAGIVYRLDRPGDLQPGGKAG